MKEGMHSASPEATKEEEDVEVAEIIPTSESSELYSLCWEAANHANKNDWEAVRQWLTESLAARYRDSLVENATYRDSLDRTPLFVACFHAAPVDVVISILDIAPETAKWVDHLGRTPLHAVFHCTDRPSAPDIAKVLLERHPESAQRKDAHGKVPMSYLIEQAHSLQSPLGDNSEVSASIRACSDQYILQVENQQQHNNSQNLFQMLDTFPDWLKKHAVLNGQVQDCLNKAVSRPFFTSIIILDVFFLLAIIGALYILGGVEMSTASNLAMYLLYLSATYFFLRNAVHSIILLVKGQLFEMPDVASMVTYLMTFSCFYIAIVLSADKTELLQHESFRWIVTITSGLVWWSVLMFFRYIRVDFAMFFGGLLAIVKSIAAFFLVFLVVLLGFAQMMWINYQNTDVCRVENNIDGESAAVFCNYWGSFLRAFTMSVGEVEENDFTNDVLSELLYIWFLFSVVIMLTNILAYIIGNQIINTKHAEAFFWLDRLDFVLGMGSVASVVPVYWNWDGGGLREIWKKITDSSLDGAAKNRGKCSFHFWMYEAVRLFTYAIVIPAWLLIGLVTAGLLWPPQVREYLFWAPVTVEDNSVKEDTTTAVLAAMKDETAALKGDVRNLENKIDKLLELLQDRGEVVA